MNTKILNSMLLSRPKRDFSYPLFFCFNFLLFTFNFLLTGGQVPQGFNYQAIARDGGLPVTTPVDVRLTIQSESGGGTEYWIEEHASVQPNSDGLFTVIIGAGVKQTGSTLNSFGEIDWAGQILFLKTEIKIDAAYVDMGTTQLWSVPYSIVAGSLTDTIKQLVVKGSTTDLEEALFEVKNRNGQTVFAVYNEGVRVYIDDGSKGKKGGFAIGGFGMLKGGDEYLRVTRDSTRIYINDLPGGKASKGGFAIGGFGSLKSDNYNFFKVDEANLKGGKSEYMKLSNINTFIGDSAGAKNLPSGDNGSYNSFIGYQSGYKNTSGHHNTYIGWKSGYNVGPNAHYNILIGNESGYNNTGSNNIFIGNRSGNRNYSGTQNVFIGTQAGQKNRSGNNNMFLGSNAGQKDSTGGNNTFIGTASGQYNIGGSDNVYIGWRAGNSNNDSSNVMIGVDAGSLATGGHNVFLGYQAGYHETGSNKLFISNSKVDEQDEEYGRNNALIYGEFDNKVVKINDVLKLVPRALAPASPEEGMIYVGTDDHIYCYLNGIWRLLDN